MLTEIRIALRPGLTLLLVLAGLTGLAYPALITGIAQVALPAQANGSLITDHGRIVGSELIAQGFTGAGYFHSRPSAAGNGYDASSSAASNLAPGSKDLRDAIAARVGDARGQGSTSPELTRASSVPPDLVTTSASGLDPDLSPEAALVQVPRIARARGIPEARVRDIIAQATAYPVLGIIGESHVNVLMMNRQLDRIGSNPAP